jgi:hypothetical protein
MTGEQASKALDALSKDLERATTASMNKVGKVALAATKREFKAQNPGRSIFSSKGGRGKPPLKVTRRSARWSESQNGHVTTFTVQGMAALIEKGGRTKPPRGGKIRPVRTKALRFQGRGGTVFADSVDHPGARVPKNPIAEETIEKTFGALPGVMDDAFAAAVRARGLS